jgi:hypothetical protein
MPKGPPRPWRALKEPRTHAHVQASVNGGATEGGHYQTLVYPKLETRETAEEVKRSLYRCAKQLGYSMHARVAACPCPIQGCTAGCQPGGHHVVYKAISKAAARAYVVQRYGTDRRKWPYNPYQRVPKEPV